MPNTKSPSKLQRHVLEAAADRPTRLVLPLTTLVPPRGAGRPRLLSGLLSAGFVEEIPATGPDTVWREDEPGQGIALRITDQGFTAIGRSPPAPGPQSRALAPSRRAWRSDQPAEIVPPAAVVAAGAMANVAERSAPSELPAPHQPSGKLGQVLATLSGDAGATLAELVTLTGWQPHTTRAALTRLRQGGHRLERLELDGRKAYRLSAAR
jgi:hypothetical protein